MISLDPTESRVLGVLVEKAQTTPGQYPLTLNALVNGCNQKNNRDPVTNLGEDDVFDALDALRAKQLARQVELAGSRVPKYRHVAREALAVDTNQLVVLAELLLRGPQTAGELRGRASRMHPIESLDVVDAVLQNLMEREAPMVERIAPAPGSRAPRYAQRLCPNLHPVETAAASPAPSGPTPSRAPAPAAPADDRLERLENEVRDLRHALRRLATSLGEADPFDATPGND